MKVWLVDFSTLAPSLGASLPQIADALMTQSYRDYAPLWEGVGVSVGIARSLDAVTGDDVAIGIYDQAAEPDALGDHETTANGRPVGRIFVAPILANGGTVMVGDLSISAVISHELLELTGDPYACWWSDAPDGYEYALELCDPVEGDSYDIDGVAVSNFVGPRYFSTGPGPYDKMGKLTAPFSMTPGGYLIRRSPGGEVTQVFGEAFPSWKRATKSRYKLRQ